MYLTVVTASKSAGIGKGLTYEADSGEIRIGSMVRVPLRKRLVEGIVMEVLEKKLQTEFDLRSIHGVLGEAPLLTDAQVKTLQWMSEYYCCSLRQAMTVWLPPPPWTRLLREEITLYKNARDDVALPRGKKAQAVMEFLNGKEWTPREEIIRETGVSSAVLKRLLTQHLINEDRKPATRNPQPAVIEIRSTSVLNEDQRKAYEEIKADPRPSLLFGITGSGKTEIYASLIADAVKAGKQAILLVPEILLTEHIIDRFRDLLAADRIAVLHSRLGMAQRKQEWRRIHAGEVSLVIGSRSALFAPLPSLGLIILDEEHEWTYKNEKTPRYHARETAEALARFAGAKLVLGSATPSLESWSRSKNGRYHIARLPQRYGSATLPSVSLVDLAETEFGKHYPFSPQLIGAIGDRLKKKEQCVLFLNRRGMASALLCLQCRRRVISPESQLPFTVHHRPDGTPYLMDHTTGAQAPVPAACPHCGSANLREIGAGTQRIEAIVKTLFPRARLLRADTDTLQSPEQMRSLLAKMRSGEADILLGTQTVVKGLDLPNVTLAAVLIADIGLSLPHFRAGERIFQLLTQLTGRSGRAKPGEVIVQTFRPDALEVVAAARHETERYLDDELKMRVHAGYPPVTEMIRILIRGNTAAAKAKTLQAQAMSAVSKTGGTLKITIAPTLFGGGREWQMLVRGPGARSLLTHLEISDVTVDIDPVETV